MKSEFLRGNQIILRGKYIRAIPFGGYRKRFGMNWKWLEFQLYQEDTLL